jgi:phosphatidylglycerophosphatase A
MKKLALFWAHFFFTGLFPLFPGTFSSAVVALIYYYLLAGQPVIVTAIAIAFVVITGVPAASYAEKFYGKKDPKTVVIDEVAGQLIALLFVPKSFLQVALAFFLFRAFDVLKPPPVGAAERLPGGTAIMLDDVIAGFYAFLFMALARKFLF